jgi:GxxExxY protein
MESVYDACLCLKLKRRGLAVARQVSLPTFYDGIKLDNGYRADAIVEKSVILAIKSVERLVPLHESQLLTYLRVSECRVGLLMNFNCVRLKDGLRHLSCDRWADAESGRLDSITKKQEGSFRRFAPDIVQFRSKRQTSSAS